MRGRKHWHKDTWQYQRILDVLDDYWLSERDEAMVVVHMAFIHEDGRVQTKEIKWRNKNSKLGLPGLMGQFKIIPERLKNKDGWYVVPGHELAKMDEWGTWDEWEVPKRDERTGV